MCLPVQLTITLQKILLDEESKFISYMIHFAVLLCYVIKMQVNENDYIVYVSIHDLTQQLI